MDILIIVAGLLAVIRAYWAFNLLREEKGLARGDFTSFLEEKNKFNLYIIIRPFFRKMQNERLKSRINILSYIIYVCFIVGMIFVFKG